MLNVPGMAGLSLFGVPITTSRVVSLLGCYLVSRWHPGTALRPHAGRHPRERVALELLGYNVPAYKTAIFTISAAMAGLAGCLFANWAEIVTPSVFSLRRRPR